MAFYTPQINKINGYKKSITALLLACMVAGTLLFGGSAYSNDVSQQPIGGYPKQSAFFSIFKRSSGPQPVVSQQTPIQGQVSQQVSHSSSGVVPPNTNGLSDHDAGELIIHHLLTSNGLSKDTVKSFELQNEDMLNAATDGSNVLFTQQLWNTLGKDDRRAFVLSHEIAHITLNHIPKTVGRRVGFGLLGRVLGGVIGGSSGGVTGAIANQAINAGLGLYDLKFSRGAEYDADEQGLVYLRNAGYDTHAAIETMDVLKAAGGGSTPEFLRSHPMEENRIDRLAAQIQ
jgi:Zn-dependent protease with chaperone function